MIHARTESELLKHVEGFLKICDEHDLRLSAKKCSFYTNIVKWCGQIVDSSVYNLDPKNIEAIRTLYSLINAAEVMSVHPFL